MPREAIVSHSIALPDGMAASIEGNTVTLSKEGNNISREFTHNRVSVSQVEDGLEVFRSLPRSMVFAMFFKMPVKSCG